MTAKGSMSKSSSNLKDRFSHIMKLQKQCEYAMDKGELTITFGSKKRGQKFSDVWEDKAYVEWFLSHCVPPAADQEPFLNYLVEKIEEVEQEQGVETGSPSKGNHPKRFTESDGQVSADVRTLRAEIAELKVSLAEIADLLKALNPQATVRSA
jgi:phage shock protein A